MSQKKGDASFDVLFMRILQELKKEIRGNKMFPSGIIIRTSSVDEVKASMIEDNFLLCSTIQFGGLLQLVNHRPINFNVLFNALVQF